MKNFYFFLYTLHPQDSTTFSTAFPSLLVDYQQTYPHALFKTMHGSDLFLEEERCPSSLHFLFSHMNE